MDCVSLSHSGLRYRLMYCGYHMTAGWILGKGQWWHRPWQRTRGPSRPFDDDICQRFCLKKGYVMSHRSALFHVFVLRSCGVMTSWLIVCSNHIGWQFWYMVWRLPFLENWWHVTCLWLPIVGTPGRRDLPNIWFLFCCCCWVPHPTIYQKRHLI